MYINTHAHTHTHTCSPHSNGCPDWDYRAKIWRETNEEGKLKRSESGHVFVYFVIQVLYYVYFTAGALLRVLYWDTNEEGKLKRSESGHVFVYFVIQVLCYVYLTAVYSVYFTAVGHLCLLRHPGALLRVLYCVRYAYTNEDGRLHFTA
jgi:hypothetical protein